MTSLPDDRQLVVTDPSADEDGEAVESNEGVLIEPAVFRPLSFEGVHLDLPAKYPTVVLQEFDAPHRQLHIPVGMAEGNAIAYAASQIPTARPLTHELMISILRAFGLEVVTLRISEYRDRTFIGELVVSGPTAQRTISCRVSDGIALCLRQQPYVPITASPSVIDQVGVSA